MVTVLIFENSLVLNPVLVYIHIIYHLLTYFYIYLDFYHIPCNVELHGYGFDDPGYSVATRSWLNINGVQELSSQWGSTNRGLAVVSFDRTTCQIIVIYSCINIVIELLYINILYFTF